MPVFARGHARFSHSGNGHCGHLPVENFRATGIAGIGFLANGRAKAGTGMPVGNTTNYYHQYLLSVTLANVLG